MQKHVILGMIFLYVSIGATLLYVGGWVAEWSGTRIMVPIVRPWYWQPFGLILLALVSTFCGILGGYLVGVYSDRSSNATRQTLKNEKSGACANGIPM